MSIMRAIPRGRENAISLSALAESLMISRRRVERDIQAIVLSGVPVLACSEGVYVATDAREVRAYAVSLGGRIAAVSDRIRALERAAERMEHIEQTELWGAA